MMDRDLTAIYLGDNLAAYGFPQGHPFGVDRHVAFEKRFREQGLGSAVRILTPVTATSEEIELFHDPAYVSFVQDASARGSGTLDYGDTPAFPGVYEAAATVVGSALDAARRIMHGEFTRAFVPIAGLHHGRRDGAAGFCVFNDCGVVLATLKKAFSLKRIAYVDIDVHHGDGVYYAFEADPDVIFADIHQYGGGFYPGTGASNEVGTGQGKGRKLNLPLPAGSGDQEFQEAWGGIEVFLERLKPEFILFQCGADGLAGDPIAGLEYSSAPHRAATKSLMKLAGRYSNGRLLALGGGGYHRGNLATAWTEVVRALSDQECQ